jgi:integrase
MPSRPLRTPKYRHHKPSGLAVVTLNGHDCYLGRYGSDESQAEYKRLVAEWLASSRQVAATATGSADLTVNELLLAYVRHADAYYRKNGKPTTEPTNIRLALRPLHRLYGHTLAKDFGPLALKSVRQAMIEADLCRNEVNKRSRHIVRMYKWAAENELVPASVHHGLKTVSGLKKGRSEARESQPIKPVPEALVDAIESHVARQVWAMIQLQRLTGMRPGEVAIMRTCDIDTSGRVWAYKPESHKTEHHEKERVIYLGPRSQAVLKPWLRTELTAYLFSPKEALEEHYAQRRRDRQTPMTPSQRARTRKLRRSRTPGDHYTTASYCHAIRGACKRAGVPNWHPHQLRHNAATWLRKEFGLDIARVILGHRSPIVTEIYAEVDREKAVAVMEKVG